jgi:hypothetical protein
MTATLPAWHEEAASSRWFEWRRMCPVVTPPPVLVHAGRGVGNKGQNVVEQQLTFGVDPRGKRRKREFHRDTSAGGLVLQLTGLAPVAGSRSLLQPHLIRLRTAGVGKIQTLGKTASNFALIGQWPAYAFDLLLLPMVCEAEIEKLRKCRSPSVFRSSHASGATPYDGPVRKIIPVRRAGHVRQAEI